MTTDYVLRPIMLRPPRRGVLDAINHCSFCGQHLWTTRDTDRHWEMGHFDRLINPDDPDYPEVLKAQATLERQSQK